MRDARRETQDARRGDGVVLSQTQCGAGYVRKKNRQTNEREKGGLGMKEGRRLQKERGEGRKEGTEEGSAPSTRPPENQVIEIVMKKDRSSGLEREGRTGTKPTAWQPGCAGAGAVKCSASASGSPRSLSSTAHVLMCSAPVRQVGSGKGGNESNH